MHNNESILQSVIKTDKELAIERLDREAKSADVNNFELRKIKLAISNPSNIADKSQISVLNTTINFPAYQYSARRSGLKISKFLHSVESQKENRAVFDGQKLRKEAIRGFYKEPFYSNPSNYQCIHPGAKFKGFQNSCKQNYNVEITIQDVQLDRSFLTGYIMIEGITQAYDKLTTFFSAELIGEHYGFLTRKWQTNEEIDKMHWMKFPAFRAYKYDQVMNMESFQYDPRQNGEYLFFRFKEEFLVPNHKIQNIPGASFAGFYYVCVGLKSKSIEGYYYHSSSQWFQKLDLRYDQQSTSCQFEFR